MHSVRRVLRELFPPRLARGAEKELTIAGIPLVLAVVASIAWPTVYTILPTIVLAIVFAILLWFFRDPRRNPPGGEGVFLSPADGEVVEIEQTRAPRFLEGEALKIGIFMSLFNVHVNRAPVEGQVALVEHVPGQFVQAFRPEAALLNEHNFIGLESRYGRVLVNQISGIMARRIVCWVRPGQGLKAGERLGVIKFGSRVEVYLPLGAEPAVQLGQQVHAGLTVIARWQESR
jgi:phosphatidylserine decarboxylase